MTPAASTPLAPRRVPEAYLRAEVAAFPLTSEKAFRERILELDPSVSPGGPTALLWRACEDLLIQRSGWSLDRLVAARDRSWFRAARAPTPMVDYLRGLAADHLKRRPGVTEIEDRTDASALDAAGHYRWLVFALPEDLLLCALGVEPAPRRVEIDPPLLLRRLLDRGVAEIHQHVGAGMDFPLLWASALAAIATPEVRGDALAGPGVPLGDGESLVRWLLAAAIARCILADHLIRQAGDPSAPPLIEFIESAAGRRTAPEVRPSQRAALRQAITALVTGRDEELPDIEPLRDLYSDLHPTAHLLADEPLTGVEDAFRRCDPVSVRLRLDGGTTGERWLIGRALHHLGETGRPGGRRDDLFARVFWQVVRVRCHYYRAVVQRPLTAGLQWFVRFYGRLGALRRPLQPIRPEVSFHVAGGEQPIASLELRTGPEDDPITMAEELHGFLCSWMRVVERTGNLPSEPEIGIVYHLAKSRDASGRWTSGLPQAFWAGTHAEPVRRARDGRMDVDRGRFVTYFREQARKARALADLIRALPEVLWLVRGVDAANDELGIPTWVHVPLFRHVVETSAAVSCARGAGPPLRITGHVGEDFRHLMEGLRRTFEQVHYVLGSSGGRLGHAVALGVDPRAWAESVGSVLLPMEDRLWDLVFEWRLYSRYRVPADLQAVAPPGRIEVLSNEIRNVSSHVLGRATEAPVLAELHHTQHRFLVPPYTWLRPEEGGPDTLLRAARGLSGERVQHVRQVRRELVRYLEDQARFERGQELIDVVIEDDEIAALRAVQDALRRAVGQRGIVVEVNPSSNLLIGDLLDLRNHPILRLFPPEPEPAAPPPVPIALGSDDPLTFSTRLVREYTLLYQTALAAGYPERTVHDWLESIRQTSMDARFTVAFRPSTEEKAGELRRALEGYLHLSPARGAARGAGRGGRDWPPGRGR